MDRECIASTTASGKFVSLSFGLDVFEPHPTLPPHPTTVTLFRLFPTLLKGGYLGRYGWLDLHGVFLTQFKKAIGKLHIKTITLINLIISPSKKTDAKGIIKQYRHARCSGVEKRPRASRQLIVAGITIFRIFSTLPSLAASNTASSPRSKSLTSSAPERHTATSEKHVLNSKQKKYGHFIYKYDELVSYICFHGFIIRPQFDHHIPLLLFYHSSSLLFHNCKAKDAKKEKDNVITCLALLLLTFPNNIQGNFPVTSFMLRVGTAKKKQFANFELSFQSSFVQWRISPPVHCIQICAMLQLNQRSSYCIFKKLEKISHESFSHEERIKHIMLPEITFTSNSATTR